MGDALPERLTGNCGSAKLNAAQTRRVRLAEGKAATKILARISTRRWPTTWRSCTTSKLLRRISAIIREVKPSIVLTHSPQDYMEDHMNTCRLAVTAAFAHGIPNFVSTPQRPACFHDVTVYHAMPHGLCGPLRQRIVPGAFVNTTIVHATKLQALAAHQSQQGWLDVSQGMNSYLRFDGGNGARRGSALKEVQVRRRLATAPALGLCGDGH